MSQSNFKSIGVLALIIFTAITLQGCIKTTSVPPEVEEMMEGETTTEEVVEKETTEAETSLKVEDGNWALDTNVSVLAWSASKIASPPHVGRVPLTEGNLEVVDGKVVKGGFTIDMNGITESKNNEDFLKHIKSDDFFGVETYPTSSFTITNVEDKGNGQFAITGDLTIRDQTHDIGFDAIMTKDEDSINTNAHFEIDRTRWGISFNSSSFFQNLGDNAIKNQIAYDLNLTFVPE